MFRKVVNDTLKVRNAGENISNGLSKMGNALKNVGIEEQKVSNEFSNYEEILIKAGISTKFITNIKNIFENSGTETVFGQADIMTWLDCSKSKATNVMNAMKQAEIVEKVKGYGAGKYKFAD